jgi:hypothetical protein
MLDSTIEKHYEVLLFELTENATDNVVKTVAALPEWF